MRKLIGFDFYVASIIVGSGLLSLPLVIADVGFVPLIITIVIVTVLMTRAYARQAQAVGIWVEQEQTEEVQWLRWMLGSIGVANESLQSEQPQKTLSRLVGLGQRLYDRVNNASRLGGAGATALSLGLLFYVFGADVSYILIGYTSIAHIATMASHHSIALLDSPFLAGLGGLLIAVSVSRVVRSGVCKKLAAMCGTWLLAVWAVSLADSCKLPISSTEIGILLYTVGVAAVGLMPRRSTCKPTRTARSGTKSMNYPAASGRGIKRRSKQKAPRGGESNPERLKPDHSVNVLLLLTEITLLIATATVALFFFARHSLLLTPRLFVRFSLDLDTIRMWLQAIGVTIFSFVGVGIFNLVAYPGLFEKNLTGRTPLQHVAKWGTFISMFIYVMWTVVTAFTVNASMLADLNANHGYSTIGMASLIEPHSAGAAWLIVLFGYLFALFAVTAACSGFTEALAERSVIVVRALRRSRPQYATQDQSSNRGKEYQLARLLILSSAMIVALLVKRMQTGELPLTEILAIAGSAGGGLLLLVSPWLLTLRKALTWRDVMLAGFFTLFISGSTAIGTVTRWGSSGNVAVRVITVGISVIVLVVGLWLIAKAVRARTSLPQTSKGGKRFTGRAYCDRTSVDASTKE